VLPSLIVRKEKEGVEEEEEEDMMVRWKKKGEKPFAVSNGIKKKEVRYI